LWKHKQQKLSKLQISDIKPRTPEIPPASSTHTDLSGTKSIINLSNYTISPAETEVITYGLTFCPTTELDPTALAADTEEFIRRQRLKEFFHTTEEPTPTTDAPTTKIPQRKKKESNFTPPEGRCRKLDTYAEVLRKSIIANYINKTRRIHHNLKPLQRQAIKSLKRNKDIVIKPADKGGAVVIQNRTDYITEARRQLDNGRDYERLSTDPTDEHQRELRQLIRTLTEDIQQDITPLIPKDPRPGTLYLLPKVHKAGNPGRPIISGNGTLCEAYRDTSNRF